MGTIRLAIAGVGNCASALLQGLEYYRTRDNADSAGVHARGPRRLPARGRASGRRVRRRRAQGRPARWKRRSFAPPNCTAIFQEKLPACGVTRVRWRRSSTASRRTWPSSRRARLPSVRRRAGRRRADAARERRRGPRLLPAGGLRASDAPLRRGVPRGGRRHRELRPRLHRVRPGVGAALRGARPPDRRRRHQEPGRRDDRPPHARASPRRPRRAPRPHLPAQHRRQHRLPQHARAEPPRARRSSRRPSRCRASSTSVSPTTDIHIGPSRLRRVAEATTRSASSAWSGAASATCR